MTSGLSPLSPSDLAGAGVAIWRTAGLRHVAADAALDLLVMAGLAATR